MTRTILIVEDEQAIADSIAYALRRMVSACSPSITWRGVKPSVRSEDAPQLVVLDIGLPASGGVCATLARRRMTRMRATSSRAQLMERVWSGAHDTLERTVDAHVKSLRAKLRAIAADLDPIQTHRGLGYSLADA